MRLTLLCTAMVLLALPYARPANGQTEERSVYAQWKNGPPADPGFFPIAVWVQEPRDAASYRAAGINVYVGLWGGPTEEQLAALKQAGMLAVCEQNEVGLRHVDDAAIIAWMHGDEPDNAQDMERVWKNDLDAIKQAWGDGVRQRPLEEWGTYGPPIPPVWTVNDYAEIVKRDPSRPVMLNLGRGVADDNYAGRGARRGKLEDYPQYMNGCDIASFDIYPVKDSRPEFHGNLWYVAKGVQHLVEWGQGRKIVWNCIEASGAGDNLITPYQLRAEVWMSLIHGSRGIIYFVHEFQPKADTRALLHRPQLLEGVTQVNGQIQRLAPVLNGPTIAGGASVTSANADVPVALMVKRHDGATYVFAVAMRDAETTATFTVAGLKSSTAEAIDEGRSIEVKEGSFRDAFKGYEVHLYRIAAAP